MTVTRKEAAALNKRERINRHVEELKSAILSRFPDAKFEVGPVPDTSWPGLWVACRVEDSSDVRTPLSDLRDAFFLAENMDVHVIVVGENEFD